MSICLLVACNFRELHRKYVLRELRARRKTTLTIATDLIGFLAAIALMLWIMNDQIADT